MISSLLIHQQENGASCFIAIQRRMELALFLKTLAWIFVPNYQHGHSGQLLSPAQLAGRSLLVLKLASTLRLWTAHWRLPKESLLIPVLLPQRSKFIAGLELKKAKRESGSAPISRRVFVLIDLRSICLPGPWRLRHLAT